MLVLVQQGRLKRFIEEANKSEKLDVKYAPFIQKITQLAQKFQAKKIEFLIKKCMDEQNR